MGLFDNLFGKKGNEIASPVSGKAVALSEVPDPTFAEGILGQGVAVIPSEGKFYAPADGEITTLFPTGHAFAMATDKGVDLLVHIGLETVGLKGSAFTIHGKEDSRVKKGDLIIEADLEVIKAAGLNTITPVIVCNSDDFKAVEAKTGSVAHGDTVLSLK